MLSFTNGLVVFSGGGLQTPLTNTFRVTQAGRVIAGGSNPMTLTVSSANGSFSGQLRLPGATKMTSFAGALLQEQDSGAGYFLGPDQAGRVCLGQAPQ